MLKTFDEKDELYTAAKSLPGENSRVKENPRSDPIASSVESRYERLNFMKVFSILSVDGSLCLEIVDRSAAACGSSPCLGHV